MLTLKQTSLKRGRKTVLSDVSLTLKSGQLLAIIGPNGAGKSSLLSMMAGDLAPSTGSIVFNGLPLKQYDKRTLAQHRAVLPQFSDLSFDFDVDAIVSMGRAPHQLAGRFDDDHAIIETAMSLAHVQPLRNRRYTTLSGGEAQRVHFARVLAQILPVHPTTPQLLLLDEPTASLDLSHAQHLLQTAHFLSRQGLGCVVVLHDLNLAASFADEIAVISDGRLLHLGTPHEVLTVPMLRDVFGLDSHIMHHPTTSHPLVVPRHDPMPLQLQEQI